MDRTRLHRVGHLADFPVQACVTVELLGLSVGVVRTGVRQVAAFQNHCPHQSAEIARGDVRALTLPSDPDCFESDGDEYVIRCPWHRWEFKLSDGRTAGEISRKRLRVFPTEVVDDDVYVALP